MKDWNLEKEKNKLLSLYSEDTIKYYKEIMDKKDSMYSKDVTRNFVVEEKRNNGK